MRVEATFDSGNIDVIEAVEPGSVRLQIRKDAGGRFGQWFHFRVSGVQGQECRFLLENAGACSYPNT